jgi:RNA polymerase sigma factor (sigma-70 family)
MLSDEHRIYREIYEQSAGRIYGYIYRKTCDPTGSEDLKQDVFLTLLFRLTSFIPDYPENRKKIEAWLFGVADNKLKHYWRDRAKLLDMEISSELLPEVADMRNDLEAVEFSLPDWLSKKDKMILSLKARGYTLKEISERLGVSYAACRMRHSRLKYDLKDYFEK